MCSTLYSLVLWWHQRVPVLVRPKDDAPLASDHACAGMVVTSVGAHVHTPKGRPTYAERACVRQQW